MTSLGSTGGGYCYGGLTTTAVVVEVGPAVCARRLRFHSGSGSGWLLMSFCLVGFWRVFCLLGHSLTHSPPLPLCVWPLFLLLFLYSVCLLDIEEREE